MNRHRFLFGFLCIFLFETAAFSKKTETKPISKSIGTYTNGCLIHGMMLNPEGVGYQSVLFSKQRLFGHPSLINFVKTLAKKALPLWKQPKKGATTRKSKEKEPIWVLGIEDLSSKAGGKTLGNHNSHQNGLDADILLSPIPANLSREERQKLPILSMVSEDGKTTSALFSKKQALLLKTAAAFPMVERIFINPVIKRALCQMSWDDRTWLRKIRPWNGHRSHFHVRLKCPKDSMPLCKAQTPPKEGDGCGNELLSWFSPKEPQKPEGGAESKKPGEQKPNPAPKECDSFWDETGILPERRDSPKEEAPHGNDPGIQDPSKDPSSSKPPDPSLDPSS